MKYILSALVLLLCVSCVEEANNYQDGNVAFDRGDYVVAFEKYTKAAKAGHAEAQYKLGRMYSSGWGVEQNYQEAMRWWRQVAETGHTDAQYNLGQMYFFAKDVPQDYGQASYWWRQAAEAGHAEAQYNLGEMYEYGWGVTQNVVQAHKWFSIAVANAPSKEARERAVSDRDDVAQMMSSEQVAEAEALAKEWLSIR